MEKKDLRIVYMGTPEFAVESLKRLVEGGYNVVMSWGSLRCPISLWGVMGVYSNPAR